MYILPLLLPLIPLLLTVQSIQCWTKPPSTTATTCVSSEITGTDCPYGSYQHKKDCCDQQFIDVLGYLRRKCSGETLKQEFERLEQYQQKQFTRSATRPVLHWRSLEDGSKIGVMKKIVQWDEGAPDDSRDEAYGEYIADYIYYHVLSDPFIKTPHDSTFDNFENQIVLATEDGAYTEYYRPFFFTLHSFEGFRKDSKYWTVGNIMQIALIAWLDLLFQNNDRFQLNVMERADINKGNLMVHETSTDIYRIDPIDNGGMRDYVKGGIRKGHYVLSDFKQMVEGKQPGLLGHAEWFIYRNFESFNSFFPDDIGEYMRTNDAMKHEVTRIVYNTWCFYGRRISFKIEEVYNNWVHRIPPHDGSVWRTFKTNFLDPAIEIGFKMPGNVGSYGVVHPAIEIGYKMQDTKALDLPMESSNPLSNVIHHISGSKSHQEYNDLYDINEAYQQQGTNLNDGYYGYGSVLIIGTIAILICCCFIWMLYVCGICTGWFLTSQLRKHGIW